MSSRADAPAIIIPEGLFLGNWAAILSQDETIQLPRNSSSLALENVRPVKSGAGVLFGFSGYSNRGSAQYIHVYDRVTPPTSGAIPVMIINVAATTDFSADYGTWGRWFTQGIWLANSSTAGSYTAGSADTWFDAQYL